MKLIKTKKKESLNVKKKKCIYFQQDERHMQSTRKWKLPPNGQPICLFSENASTQGKKIIRPDDDSKYSFVHLLFFIKLLAKLRFISKKKKQ